MFKDRSGSLLVCLHNENEEKEHDYQYLITDISQWLQLWRFASIEPDLKQDLMYTIGFTQLAMELNGQKWIAYWGRQ